MCRTCRQRLLMLTYNASTKCSIIVTGFAIKSRESQIGFVKPEQVQSTGSCPRWKLEEKMVNYEPESRTAARMNRVSGNYVFYTSIKVKEE